MVDYDRKVIIEATKKPFCLTVSDKNGKLLYTELAEQRFYKDSVKRKLFYNRMSISLVLGNVWISWISEGVRSI